MYPGTKLGVSRISILPNFYCKISFEAFIHQNEFHKIWDYLVIHLQNYIPQKISSLKVVKNTFLHTFVLCVFSQFYRLGYKLLYYFTRCGNCILYCILTVDNGDINNTVCDHLPHHIIMSGFDPWPCDWIKRASSFIFGLIFMSNVKLLT